MQATDPELAEILGNFAFDEIHQQGDLDLRTRVLVTMASTITQNTIGEYRKMLYAAYSNRVTPMEVKEVLYHAVPYVGYPRTLNAIACLNEIIPDDNRNT